MIRVMNTLSFMVVLNLVMMVIEERGGIELKRIMHGVICDLIHKKMILLLFTFPEGKFFSSITKSI
ncbi:hypothetical protein A7311_06295 [Paenibacillus polymyxa]|nr:hypothetical protein [Paenibacillus sp. 1182]ODB53222.1 hypothetical protein A7311_06295 [Paenibacillus polymyxa]